MSRVLTIVDTPVVCNDRYRENRGEGLDAEVDELRGGFFRALCIGTGLGAVSSGTRPPKLGAPT